jgi:hypothetical protein
LTIISFFSAFAAGDDEGANFITLPLKYIYIILNFPAIPMIGTSLILRHPVIGFLGLGVNILIYAFLIERLHTWLVKKRKTRAKT